MRWKGNKLKVPASVYLITAKEPKMLILKVSLENENVEWKGSGNCYKVYVDELQDKKYVNPCQKRVMKKNGRINQLHKCEKFQV